MSFINWIRSLFSKPQPKPAATTSQPRREQVAPPQLSKAESWFIPDFRSVEKKKSIYPLASRSSLDPDMGGSLNPTLVVWHHTVSYDIPGTESWFKDTAADIHLLVGKLGEVVQMVPFNRVAHHAGASSWNGKSGLNNHAIGIEFVNLGPLRKSGEKFLDYYGRDYKGPVRERKTHGFQFWEPGTEAQEQRFLEIGLFLYVVWGIPVNAHIGHYECSPARKNDPAGFFSWGSMASARLALTEYIAEAKRRGLAS